MMKSANVTPLRILHLASEFPPQPVFGLGRYVNELAEAQAAAGESVSVITNTFGGLEEFVNRRGIDIYRVLFPPPPEAPATSAKLLHFNLHRVERCIELTTR